MPPLANGRHPASRGATRAPAAARGAAYAGVSEIRFRGAQVRTDIAERALRPSP